MPTENDISKSDSVGRWTFQPCRFTPPEPLYSRPKLDVVTNLNIAEESIQRFTVLLREELEVVASSTHAFYFGTWDHGSHSCSNRYTALLTEMIYGTRPTDQRLIRVVS